MASSGERLLVSDPDENGFVIIRDGEFRALHEGIEHRRVGGFLVPAWPQVRRLIEPGFQGLTYEQLLVWPVAEVGR